MSKDDVFNDLTDEELSLVTAFARAVRNERDQTTYNAEPLADGLKHIAKSGLLSDLFDKIQHLSQQPPARAPRLWDPDGDEPPAIAILDIYGYWIDRGQMHQGILHALDEELYKAYYSSKRSLKKMGPEERAVYQEVLQKVPTKKEYNSRLLEQELPRDKAERERILAVVSVRKYRASKL